MDRSIIYAASGGALGDMTPFEARSLIEKMASNSQQFNARSGDAIVVRGVHDVGRNAARQDKLETKIDSLTTFITQLAINQQTSSMARVCGICTSSDHYSDMCPSLLDTRTRASINVMPMNVFKFLSLGPLQPTGVVIQLSNRKYCIPCQFGIGCLGSGDQLIFPADFTFLIWKRDPLTILRTTRTKIDVHAGTLSVEFDDKVARFNIFYALKHPSEGHS
ncbi:hypothetical protein Lal_00013185, partial [Lupinus albus]